MLCRSRLPQKVCEIFSRHAFFSPPIGLVNTLLICHRVTYQQMKIAE